MHARTIAVLTVLVSTFFANSSDGHGLLRRHHKHRGSHATNAAAAPNAQNTPAPQATPPAPTAAVIQVPAATNADIQARIKAWEDAYGVTATGQRVTIKVDGKDVVLEIRVISTKGPGNGGGQPGGDADLAKAIEAAKDHVTAAVRKSGLGEAAILYGTLADNVRVKNITTLTNLFKQRDFFLALRANAKQLTATNQVVDAHLRGKLKGMNDALDDTNRAKVETILDEIAKTLKSVQ